MLTARASTQQDPEDKQARDEESREECSGACKLRDFKDFRAVIKPRKQGVFCLDLFVSCVKIICKICFNYCASFAEETSVCMRKEYLGNLETS